MVELTLGDLRAGPSEFDEDDFNWATARDRIRTSTIGRYRASARLAEDVTRRSRVREAADYAWLSAAAKAEVIAEIQKLIKTRSHVFRVDVHLSFAIRVLAHSNSPDNQALLQQIYEERTSPIARRDIILVLAKWSEWYWLSDVRNRFRELSGPERRAFIVASYILKDEGDHWRRHIGKELNPFERFIMSWAGQKASNLSWTIPL